MAYFVFAQGKRHSFNHLHHKLLLASQRQHYGYSDPAQENVTLSQSHTSRVHSLTRVKYTYRSHMICRMYIGSHEIQIICLAHFAQTTWIEKHKAEHRRITSFFAVR